MPFLTINNIVPFTKLSTGFGILLINPGETPPHLAIVSDNIYYDISISGVRKIEWSVIIQKFKTKKTSFIFIELKSIVKHIKADDFFNDTVSLKNKTCLEPIKKIVQTAYAIDTTNAKVIFDLLEILTTNNLIENYYGYLTSNSFNIKCYTHEDVLKHIETLKKNPANA